MNPALAAALALPAGGGAALLLAGRRADRVAPAAGIGVASAVLLLVVAASVSGGGGALPFVPGGPFAAAVDGLSAVVLVTVAAVAVLVLAFAAAEGQQPAARFTGLMLVFVAAVVLTASATTLPALLAGWEVMGATSALLIGLRTADAESVAGGLTAFVTTRTADLGLYLAAGAAAAAGGGFALADLAGAPAPWRDVLAAGVLVAALGKSAQLPFSFWLSRAMTGPSAVSALLHSAAMVAMGGYLLLRMRPLLAAVPWAGPTTAWLGAATAVLLGIVALAQTDLKQLLAASTAAQLGFVVLAAGAGTVTGGAAQLVAHAATKAALFLVAGAWLSAWGARRLDDAAGAGRRDRRTGVLATIAAVCLAGLPPLSIWAAKDLIVSGADPALAVAALVAAVLAAGYAARIVRTVWRNAAPSAQARPIRTAVVLPAAVLVVAAVAGGALALPAVADRLAGLVGAPAVAVPLPLLLVSALLAALAFAAGLLRDAPRLRFAERWLGLEGAAHRLVVHPVLALAHGASRADDLLGAAVAGVGPSVRSLARAAARLDDGLETGVQASGGATAALATAAARLDSVGPGGLLRGVGDLAAAAGRAARRPQTGQLHQYYAAAAIATAVLVVLAVVVR